MCGRRRMPGIWTVRVRGCGSTLEGRGPATARTVCRGCGAADVAAVEGLAPDRAGGSGGGSGRPTRQMLEHVYRNTIPLYSRVTEGTNPGHERTMSTGETDRVCVEDRETRTASSVFRRARLCTFSERDPDDQKGDAGQHTELYRGRDQSRRLSRYDRRRRDLVRDCQGEGCRSRRRESQYRYVPSRPSHGEVDRELGWTS